MDTEEPGTRGLHKRILLHAQGNPFVVFRARHHALTPFPLKDFNNQKARGQQMGLTQRIRLHAQGSPLLCLESAIML